MNKPATKPTNNNINEKNEWMSEELRLVLMRQTEFKKAALAAKQRGDLEMAKEYLTQAHRMDQMVFEFYYFKKMFSPLSLLNVGRSSSKVWTSR